jgi:predicted aminopeptidase
VVWNVVATPEFSVVPHHWCFPVAGCVAYRGYFHEASAVKFAAGMAARGYDVAVDGVPAYSTLGKFADPVLSSMMRYGDDELAATIFHELAHQLLYVKDDSAFNEAFATTVEDAGLERWLAQQGTPARMHEFRADQVREAAFVKLLAGARAQLATLYASGLAPEPMRKQKAAILAALGADIRAFEQREGVSYPLYDEWIKEGLNNARLASVATYYDCVPGFKRLLAHEDNDLPRFYAAARELAHRSRAERHALLCGSAAVAADAEEEED